MLFKKRKHVYNLLIDFAVDFDSTGSPTARVFKNKKKAYKAFLEEIDTAKIDGDDFDNKTEESNLDVSKLFDELPLHYYQIFSDGEYSRNHIEVQLIEQQLQ